MTEVTTTPQSGRVFLERPFFEDSLHTAFKVDKVLLDTQSEFQRIQVVEAGPIGRALILDQVIQTTEFDESAYHEMMTHVPLLAHPNPRAVLVIGGGDGGALREIAKHPSVERMDICEIDGGVIEACKAHMPKLAAGYGDPRVSVHLADGAKFAAEHPGAYDAIIVDSSDPIGPAEVLFKAKFFEDCKKALRPGGVLVTQAESYYLHRELLTELFKVLSGMFERPLYYYTEVPTYPGGGIGFSFCSLGPDPLLPPDPARVKALGKLEYYTPAAGRAAFALPQRALDLLPEKIAKVQAAL